MSKGFREFGIPQRIANCYSLEYILQLSNHHSGTNNCYVSFYAFTLLNNGKTIYDSNFGVDFPGGKGPGSYDFPITDFESWDKEHSLVSTVNTKKYGGLFGYSFSVDDKNNPNVLWTISGGTGNNQHGNIFVTWAWFEDQLLNRLKERYKTAWGDAIQELEDVHKMKKDAKEKLKADIQAKFMDIKKADISPTITDQETEIIEDDDIPF